MLIVSGIVYTNPKNTSNWLLEASETIKINPKMDSGRQFHLVITPKTHSQGNAKVHMIPRPPYYADAIRYRPTFNWLLDASKTMFFFVGITR